LLFSPFWITTEFLALFISWSIQKTMKR
jgi:hypothetical protein